MKITLIAAVDEQNGIGKDGSLAWKNSEDMAHFRSYTDGKVVVMGRKTWDSLPVKPLPRRLNWVLTQLGGTKELIAMADSNYNLMCSDMEYLQKMINYHRALNAQEICIIGGQSIYEQFMPYATNIVLTRIKGNYDCDRFFPAIDDSFTLVKTEQKQTCVIEYYERGEK